MESSDLCEIIAAHSLARWLCQDLGMVSSSSPFSLTSLYLPTALSMAHALGLAHDDILL
jgi:hypothetical protein